MQFILISTVTAVSMMHLVIECFLHLFIAGNAILLNGLLLLATFRAMPKGVQSYAILTNMQAIADLISSVFMLTTMQRYVSTTKKKLN